LTHYMAERMKRPSKLSSRALEMVPTWTAKPKKLHRYHWDAYGGEDLGVSPPGFELSMLASEQKPPEKRPDGVRTAIKFYQGEGDISGYMLASSVRLLLPVDHALAEGNALTIWLENLDLIKRGNFDSVACSYALSAWTHLDAETSLRER